MALAVAPSGKNPPPGPPARKIEFDVEAIVLSAICVFLWLSLLSYDAADSLGELPRPLSYFVAVDNAVYPPNPHIQNVCGWFGALTATILVQSFGIGSILVALGLTVLAAWMFRVQTNYVRATRQLGWVLIIASVTTIVSLLRLQMPFSPMIGPGGYLGAITSTWLHEHFAMLGAIILAFAMLLSGILLSTDYVIVRAVGWLAASLAAAVASIARFRFSLPLPAGAGDLTGGQKRSSDVDQGVVLAGRGPATAESVPAVRISGKNSGDKTTSNPSSANASSQDMTVAGAASLAKSAGNKVASWLGLNKASDLEARLTTGDDRSIAQPEALDEAHAEPAALDGSDSDEPISDHIELTTEDGGTLQLRADAPHDVAASDPEPSVRPSKGSKGKSTTEDHAASLAGMDDTKLPPGADEYVLPTTELLEPSDDVDFEAQTIEVRRKAKILEATFKNFGLNVRVVEIETGPVIAQYEIELEAGLRLAKVTTLADDLAIALRVPSVRIVAPIPGKNTVGIEVPNETRQVVRLREVIDEMGPKGRKAKIPLFLGKDVSGSPLIADLATLPHLLIAGRTGTGKSVCLNAIISSILMTRRPDEVRMLMIDPKMVEMIGYGRLPHLMHPVVTDMRKAEAILAWAVDKMEERYSLLARAGVRHLTGYNELDREELLDRIKPETPEEASSIPDHLPFIVIVADEMADLMMTAGKDVEQHIIRLAQKSRAVGIHLILATQKPTVDVITGLIKSNLPARISFQVASRTDSRVVLDEMGADKLLGNGDMLFLWPGTSTLLRGQGTYMSDDEINRIVDHCSTGEQNFVTELVNLKIKEESDDEAAPMALKKRDELYAAAVDIVVREGRGSCSLLQRALGIGYGRAARLIDYMAEDGIVGQYAGSQAREVIISLADWEAMQSASTEDSSGPSSPPASPPARNNRIRPVEEPTSDPSVRSPGSALTKTPKRVRQPVDALTEEQYELAEDSSDSEDLPWTSTPIESSRLAVHEPEDDSQYEYEDVED